MLSAEDLSRAGRMGLLSSKDVREDFALLRVALAHASSPLTQPAS